MTTDEKAGEVSGTGLSTVAVSSDENSEKQRRNSGVFAVISLALTVATQDFCRTRDRARC
jgi:hypothetical protein